MKEQKERKESFDRDSEIFGSIDDVLRLADNLDEKKIVKGKDPKIENIEKVE